MRQAKQLSVLHYLGAALLLAAMLLCAGCAGGSSSTAPAVDAAGAPPPPRAIQGIGEKPVSVPDASPKSGGAPLLVHFWDGGSYDPDGEIVIWSWNFGDSSNGDPGWENYTGSRGEAWHEYTSPGIKVAHLWVYDNDFNSDVAFVKIEMKQGNNANPIAVATGAPTEGNAPLAVNFSAAGSYDPDGNIVKYEWNFGDTVSYGDFTDTGGATSHVYAAEGTYTAILQVTDDDGAQSMDSVEITVAAPRDEWWMFGHDATHNRCSPFTGPTTDALEWSFATGSYVYSSPAISADGTIYVGSFDNNFYAINPNGTQKWSFTTGGYIQSSPAISADGTIYVGSDKFYAINPDGTLKWSNATIGYVFSSPTIGANGTIYVAGVINAGDFEEQTFFYALNANGTLKWSIEIGNNRSSSPAIDADGTVYVGGGSSLYAINPDGTVKWSDPGAVSSSPAIGPDGTIYVCGRRFDESTWDPYLYAINPNGSLKWSYATNSTVYLSPAIDSDGTIYVGSTYAFGSVGHWSYEGKLSAINPDGTLQWYYWADGTFVYSSPAIDADGTIYLGSPDHKLYAINSGGTLGWTYTTGGYVESSPAIGADGTIYVGSDDGKLYAFGPGEGI